MIYTFDCPNCGHIFDRRTSVLIPGLDCPLCGRLAGRRTVYASNFRIGRAVPPQGDPERLDHEKRELKKRGWDGDRAVDVTRKGRVEGEKGTYKLDFEKARKAGA